MELLKSLLETHPYIDKHPIDFSRRNIFIGTFPPNMTNRRASKLDFYYGGNMDLWSILSKIYKNEDFTSLEGINQFLFKYSFSITDIIYKCKRKFQTSSLDKELTAVELNPYLIKNLANSQIENIYFNSKSGMTSSLRLFLNAFNIKYIGRFNNDQYTLNIGDKLLNCYNLYSCSPSALTGIVNSKHFISFKEMHPLGDLCEFRVWYYKKYLPKPIN